MCYLKTTDSLVCLDRFEFLGKPMALENSDVDMVAVWSMWRWHDMEVAHLFGLTPGDSIFLLPVNQIFPSLFAFRWYFLALQLVALSLSRDLAMQWAGVVLVAVLNPQASSGCSARHKLPLLRDSPVLGKGLAGGSSSKWNHLLCLCSKSFSPFSLWFSEVFESRPYSPPLMHLHVHSGEKLHDFKIAPSPVSDLGPT